MAVSAKAYGNMNLSAFNGLINWSSGAIKVMLTTSSYTPDQDAHIYKSSVTNEVSGAGYVTRGQALTSKTITYNGTNNTVTMDAADTVWANSTITARYAIIYQDSGVDATSPLLGYVDFGADFSSSNGNFQLTWDANGIFTVSTT